jgi:hypothetical protein
VQVLHACSDVFGLEHSRQRGPGGEHDDGNWRTTATSTITRNMEHGASQAKSHQSEQQTAK